MAKISSELEMSYREGQQDATFGKPIRTKANFMANNVWNLPHDLMVDKYYSYSSGYRYAVAQRQVKANA